MTLPGGKIPLLALLGAFVPLSAGAQAPRAAERPDFRDREVVDLSFEGNRAFGDGELAAAIETQQTHCRSFLLELIPICPLTDWGFAHRRAFLDERELPADLLRVRVFYRQRGYRGATVDTAVQRLNGRARVTFRIEEGEPTRLDSLAVEGLDGILDMDRVRRDIGLETGDPLDLVRLEEGKQTLRDRLLDRGYVGAAVLEEVFIPPGEGARVTLNVHPGPRARIGRVEVEGAEEVGDRVVRQFLTFGPGDYYSQARIVESQRALFDLGAIRFASISRIGEPGPADSVVDVRVQVTETVPRSARLGGGVSTTECFLTEGRIIHRNFLGGARRLELSGRLANLFAGDFEGSFPCTQVGEDSVFHRISFRVQGEFRQPYFFSGRNSFRGALFFERESVPDLFVRTSRGAELSVTRRLRPRMFATLSYRPDLSSFEERSADVFFCVSFGFCQPEDIAVLTDTRWLAPVALGWRYDRTDAPFQPRRGYYVSLELERAEEYTGSDFGYVRLALEAADFEEMGERLVAAARLRGGLVEPTEGLLFEGQQDPVSEVVHPRKRFFGGGPTSVRGFGLNLLGPTVLVVDSMAVCPERPVLECAQELADTDPGRLGERPIGGNAAYELSLELRRDLNGPWGVVGFLDMGQVLPSIDRVDGPAVTPGFGVRYSSPFGPIRLDLGYNSSRPRRLPVVAQLEGGAIRELPEPIRFDPFGYDDPSLGREILRRLQFHLSIGEAF